MKIWVVCKSETNAVDGWCRVFNEKGLACHYAYGVMLSELENECDKETVIQQMSEESKNNYNLLECVRSAYEHMLDSYINIYEEEIEV